MAGIRTGLIAATLLGLTLVACGGDNGGETTTNTTVAKRPDVVFSVTLEGSNEAPGPGDLDGTGTAQITVNPDGNEVCYTLTVDGIDNVTGAHIHEGRGGTAGPIAVTLDAPVTAATEACAETTSSIIEGLSSGDRSFYVNIHSTEFPDGAVRAQLTG